MLLVVNAGSSSLKVSLFDPALAEVARGMVAEIGGAARIEAEGARGPVVAPDHGAALAALLSSLGIAPARLMAAAHRVVHGGAALVAPCRIDAAAEAQIEALVPLAPLHNPAHLAGIRAVRALAPDLPQYASFDTAFHATNPDVAREYALPAAERARGLRRYGFHGLSYAALVRRLAAGPDGLPGRVLAFHLGNGASACAIVQGRSVATSMGWSPVDGLTMGTRPGSLDPMVVLDLAARHGIDGAARMLSHDCGLKALGGQSDMRALRAAGTAEAAFALAHFRYWAVRQAGSLIAAMGGLDAVVFTGGIGENDAAMRAGILEGLAFAGVAPAPKVAPGSELSAEAGPSAGAGPAEAGRSAGAGPAGLAGSPTGPGPLPAVPPLPGGASGALPAAGGLLSPPGARVTVWVIAAEEERQIAGEALALWRADPQRGPG